MGLFDWLFRKSTRTATSGQKRYEQPTENVELAIRIERGVAPTNVSHDGSPVQFRMDSALLACFDPLALDMLGDVLRPGTPFNIGELLERMNANHSSMACFTIPDFRPGLSTLDPRDIKKFGDEDDDIGYNEGDQKAGDETPDYLWASVDSGTLMFADVAHLPKLATLLTWEQYDRSLGDDSILPAIVERLGGPHFAVVVSDSRLGMQFDGDGTYTIPANSLKLVRG
jgi:hypothetical protein